MKTHRPWQPHMSSAPLFNPFVPSTSRDLAFDHLSVDEEQKDESESSTGQLADQVSDPVTVAKKD
jgi:hypothetical protein